MRNLYYCVLIAVLFVLSLVGGAWADCSTIGSPYYYWVTIQTYGQCYSFGSASCSPKCNASMCSSLSAPPDTIIRSGSDYYTNFVLWTNNANYCSFTETSGGGCGDIRNNGAVFRASTKCSSQIEADSVACLNAGNQWIDGACCDEQCVCEKDGGQWVDGACQNCNDHVDMPDQCQMSWNKGYSTDASGNPGGGGYWQIEIYECFYDSCQMSMNCTPKSAFPAGSLTCDDFQDTTASPGNCVAAVGSSCTISCPNNRTIYCDCDGSCEHAKTLSACACPSSSNSGGSSSSGDSSGSSDSAGSSSSSGNSPGSSDSPGSSGSGADSSGTDWEYDYRAVLGSIDEHANDIETNTGVAAGYLSSIDRWQSTLNMSIQANTQAVNAVESEAAAAAEAFTGVQDSLGSTNEILRGISGTLSDSVDIDTGKYSGWVDSTRALVDSLKARTAQRDTLDVDSIKGDTSTYKSNYSKLFLSNAYSQTVTGCYEFRIKKPTDATTTFGRMMTDIYIDFGNVAGMFDLCSIGRGIVRACGAILSLLILIGAYRSAFGGGD